MEMFSKEDEELIRLRSMTVDQVKEQVKRFRRGMLPVRLYEPAIIGNGIMRPGAEEMGRYIAQYDQFTGTVSGFIPASGAASRMFRHLFEFYSAYDGSQERYEILIRKEGKTREFFMRMEEFAFYPELSRKFMEVNGYSINEARLKKEFNKILDVLLTKNGMNYGELPKALLTFHRYGDDCRKAAHEQLMEGMAYAVKEDHLHLHFTVSPGHRELFKKNLDPIAKEHVNPGIIISYSIQDPGTDIIAVDEKHEPFREKNGKLLFRPAGHGALLENLNRMAHQIIFIKNIDNVAIDRLKPETAKYKKLLAGVLLYYQNKAHWLLAESDRGNNITKEGKALLAAMGLKGTMTAKEVVQKLNRPVRVCGMVKNEGEPGGGPFWVDHGDKKSLQIVEEAQINASDPEQARLFKRSTHFSPVGIVCGLYDHQEKKFDLLAHRNMEAGIITGKSHEGRKLRAMELPGLWNGGMEDWNTVFVEVPVFTFNPVKTVNDLLRPQHQ